MLDCPGDGTDLARAAGHRNDIKVRGQQCIARTHIEHALARPVKVSLAFADDDVVFAGRQVRYREGELFAKDFLPERLRIAVGTLNGEI